MDRTAPGCGHGLGLIAQGFQLGLARSILLQALGQRCALLLLHRVETRGAVDHLQLGQARGSRGAVHGFGRAIGLLHALLLGVLLRLCRCQSRGRRSCSAVALASICGRGQVRDRVAFGILVGHVDDRVAPASIRLAAPTILHAGHHAPGSTWCRSAQRAKHEVGGRVLADFLAAGHTLGAQVRGHAFRQLLRALLQRRDARAGRRLAQYRAAGHAGQQRVEPTRHQLAGEAVAERGHRALQQRRGVLGLGAGDAPRLVGRCTSIDHAAVQRAGVQQLLVRLLGDELPRVLHALARCHGAAHRAGCARAARGQRRGHHREHRTEHVSALHQEAAHGRVLAEVDLALEQVARDLGVGHRVLRGLAGRVVDGLLRIAAGAGQRLGARQAHANGRALGLQFAAVELLLRHRAVDGLVCVNAWDEGTAGHDRGGVSAGAAAHRGADARLRGLGHGRHARSAAPPARLNTSVMASATQPPMPCGLGFGTSMEIPPSSNRSTSPIQAWVAVFPVGSIPAISNRSTPPSAVSRVWAYMPSRMDSSRLSSSTPRPACRWGLGPQLAHLVLGHAVLLGCRRDGLRRHGALHGRGSTGALAQVARPLSGIELRQPRRP
ncbi:MAG: hypothetical protein PBV86_23505 [Delftia lacustris]|uniref:hypothetical protein n=1 Tax=Delftia lacustris TaxID=558537 RepID=UPI002F40953F